MTFIIQFNLEASELNPAPFRFREREFIEMKTVTIIQQHTISCLKLIWKNWSQKFILLELGQIHLSSDTGYIGVNMIQINGNEVDYFLCIVCQQKHQRLYSVALCNHSFCQHCSVAYISSQANNFDQAQCLQQGCGAPLDKALPIYSMLDPPTLHKLDQYETYKFLQSHHQYMACKAKDCSGMFKKKSRQCEVCQAMHCSKCLSLVHQGKCVESNEEKSMRQLGYQKCPSCRVWVERNQGCPIMSCKCGTDFCYRCGSFFVNDPCRKGQLWQHEAELRALIGNLPSLFSKQLLDIILLVPRILLSLAILIPFTILYCLILTAVFFVLFLLVISIGVPIALVVEMDKGTRCCRLVFVLLFLPLLIGLSAGFFVLAMIMYPFCRNCNTHGLYDGLDELLANVAIYYLTFTTNLLHCIYCTQKP